MWARQFGESVGFERQSFGVEFDLRPKFDTSNFAMCLSIFVRVVLCPEISYLDMTRRRQNLYVKGLAWWVV